VSDFTDADFAFVDALMVPASLHDVSGVFVHMNAAAEEAAGHPKPNWVGRHHLDPVPPEAREHVAAQFRRALETGEPTSFETVFHDAAGRLRQVRAQHFPLRRGGKLVGVLIVAYDVLEPSAEPAARARAPQLTARQQQVLLLLAAGRSTAQIAKELTLSTETVRNHLRSVFRELGVHTRLEAIAAAQKYGLLATPGLKPTSGD
jgi:PAS domain S-box-containing protein